MKSVLAIAMAMAFGAGCTMTNVTVSKEGEWTVRRVSVLQKVTATVDIPGVGKIDQYANDGGGEAFASVAQKFYEMGKKAAVTAAK